MPPLTLGNSVCLVPVPSGRQPVMALHCAYKAVKICFFRKSVIVDREIGWIATWMARINYTADI